MEDPSTVPAPAAGLVPAAQIQQDTACSMPSGVSKFDNTKRRKPWEVFKKQPQDEQIDNSLQYDSFRDKCPQSSQQGPTFPTIISSKKGFHMTTTTTPQHSMDSSLTKTVSVSNPSSKSRMYKGPGLISEYTSRTNGNSYSSSSNSNGGSYNNSKRPYQQQNSKGYSRSSASKSTTMTVEETNENTNSANLRYESKESNGSGSLESGEADSRHRLNNRRQKASGSWSRISEKQRLDRPPSYKDYLGALTSQAGRFEASEGMFPAGDLEDGEIKLQEEESQKRLLGTLGANGPPMIPPPPPPLSASGASSKTFTPSTPQNASSHSHGNMGGSGQKPSGIHSSGGNNNNNNGNNHKKSHVQKQAGQQRKPELEEENNSKKRLKPNENDGGFAQMQQQSQQQQQQSLQQQQQQQLQQLVQASDLDDSFHLLKRMDQLGTEVFKNKHGNNYQMQQTLAAQQDAFLHQYFNKQRPHTKLLEAQGIHGAQMHRKDRKFDIKHYQVDLQKNMIDKKVTITEGLLNLAKIQSEMYSVANAKKRSTDAPSEETNGMTGGNEPGNNNRRNEKFQAALNQFEEKHMQQLNQKKKKQYGRNGGRGDEDKKGGDDPYNFDNDLDSVERMDDEEDEFEKFNEQYLKRHEQMLEDIANRNKENLKKTINPSTTKEIEPVPLSQMSEDQINPLEILIKEELEKNRQDKQAQSHRLSELTKLQESHHVKHLDMGVKKKPEQQSQQQQQQQQRSPHSNRFSQIPAPNQSSNNSNSSSSMNQLNQLPSPNNNSNMERDARDSRDSRDSRDHHHHLHHHHNNNSSNNGNQSQKQRQTRFPEKYPNPSDQMSERHNRQSSSQFSSNSSRQHGSSSSQSSSSQQSSSRNYGFPVPPPPPPPPIGGNSITSLAQLQHTLFNNPPKPQAPSTPQQQQQSQSQQLPPSNMPLPPPQPQQIPLPPQHQPPAPALPAKPSVHQQIPQPIPQPQSSSNHPQSPQISFQQHSQIQGNRRKESYQLEEAVGKAVAEKSMQQIPIIQSQAPSVMKEDVSHFGSIGAPSQMDQEIEIPDAIKAKQSCLRPALYDKVVSDYIRLQKKQNNQESYPPQQQEKIQDPRRRVRPNHQPPIQTISAPSVTQEVLPIPSLKEDDMEIEQEYQQSNSLPLPESDNVRVLHFSVDQSSSQDDNSRQRIELPTMMMTNNTVYNYKLLKSDRTMITQERNLAEKNHELTLQNQQSNGSVGAANNNNNDSQSENNNNTNFGDLYKGDKDIRYFKDNLSTLCFKCGQNGHLSKWCTAEGFDEKTRCLFCMGEHSKDVCTSYVCFKCYKVGHRIRDCVAEYQHESTRCRQCKLKGHHVRACGVLTVESIPKNFDYASISDTICLNCDGVGHINCFDSGTYAMYDGLYQIEERHTPYEIL